MAKFSDLRRHAQSSLTPALAAVGFQLAKKKLTYWRRVGEIYQVILCDLSINADRVQVYVNLWVPEGSPNYDMSLFPSGLPMYSYQGLSPKGFEPWPTQCWDVSTEVALAGSLRTMTEVVLSTVLPAYEVANSREAVVDWMPPDYKKNNGYIDRVLRRSSA